MNTIFESLQETSNRLNSTGDEANELIRIANERLGSMGAGVAFSGQCELRQSPFSRYNDDEGCQEDAGYDSAVLSYGKILGTWQLGVQTQHFVCGTSGYVGDYDLVGSEEEPLLCADRELRIEAASKMPAFLRAYTAYLERLANKLSQPEQED